MNVTLDDNSILLTYSDDWRVAPDGDPNLSKYFQNTYHASQSKGASVTFSFVGTAVYIYGSRGPIHAGYTVQVKDSARNEVQEFAGSSNNSPFAYQQLLYGRVLGNGNDTHTVVLRNNAQSPQLPWLDIDYIVITDGSNAPPATNPGSFPTTVSPSIAPSSSSAAAGSPPNASAPVQPNLIPALAALAAILGLLIVAIAGFFLYRKRQASIVRQEHAFRHGASTPLSTTKSATSPTDYKNTSSNGLAAIGSTKEPGPKSAAAKVAASETSMSETGTWNSLNTVTRTRLAHLGNLATAAPSSPRVPEHSRSNSSTLLPPSPATNATFLAGGGASSGRASPAVMPGQPIVYPLRLDPDGAHQDRYQQHLAARDRSFLVSRGVEPNPPRGLSPAPAHHHSHARNNSGRFDPTRFKTNDPLDSPSQQSPIPGVRPGRLPDHSFSRPDNYRTFLP